MNFAAFLRQNAIAFPDLPAIGRGHSVWATYRRLEACAAAIGGGLLAAGLAPGDRVALAMTNCAEYYAVLFGAWHAGLVAVPINARLHPAEFEYILDDSGARVAFATPELAATLAPLVGSAARLERVLDVREAEFGAMLDAPPAELADARPDAPAWLFYTSGTTGRPKGAILTHRNLLAMVLAYYADIDPVAPGDSFVHPTPMSHGSGLYGLGHVARAAANVIPESGRFDAAELVDLVEAWGGASFFAAPTVVARLVDAPGAARLEGPRLKTIVYGGGPMYLADLERAMSAWGPKLSHIYGQGEAPMTITGLSKAHHADDRHPRHRERLASTGYPRTGVEVRIAGEDDAALPFGETGQVLARGDVVMAGYWRNPEATAEALRGGWLHTGDVGVVDPEGFLTLKDRVKDLIITGGTNVYPREVEEVLLRHPDVLETSVVGRPHPQWGEEIVAFVVARPGGAPSEAALERLCLERIARFKRPRAYYFVDALPKNNYGKVLKTALRERLAHDASRERA